MPLQTPSYLYLRGNIWWFRYRLPKPLDWCILRISLKTVDGRRARWIALYLASYLRRIVELWAAHPVSKQESSRLHRDASHSEIAMHENGVGYLLHVDSQPLKSAVAPHHFSGRNHLMVTYCQKTANRIIDNFINSRHQELLDSWLSRGEC